jgi:DNA-binding response OmpR family regulator
VDDDDAVRTTMSRILIGAGYRVIEASKGQEALDQARAVRVDAVVLDVHLPDANGVDLCDELKSMYGGNLAVLQVSGSAVTVADRVRGLTSGADCYLVKPVAPAELVATLGSVLRSASQQRAIVVRRPDTAQRV